MRGSSTRSPPWSPPSRVSLLPVLRRCIPDGLELGTGLPFGPAVAVGEVMAEKKKPFYKNWKFWAAVGGSVAVVGTGAYLVTRRY